MRMTLTTRLVLQALLDTTGRPVHGFELAQATGLAGGTVYPILHRLTAAGWTECWWEDHADAGELGRPLRRFYRLTETGRTQADAALTRRPIRPPG